MCLFFLISNLVTHLATPPIHPTTHWGGSTLRLGTTALDKQQNENNFMTCRDYPQNH